MSRLRTTGVVPVPLAFALPRARRNHAAKRLLVPAVVGAAAAFSWTLWIWQALRDF